MSSFYNYLSNWDKFDYIKFLQSRTEIDIKQILEKEKINELDFLALLSSKSDLFLEQMAVKSSSITKREFGQTILIFTPLYLSNFCSNGCTYCGFHKKNKIKRGKLTKKEIIDEAIKIRELGIQHILILTGGDRIRSPFEYIRDSIIIMKQFFKSISIEVYALSEEEYLELHRLGVDNLTLYQETYNKSRYEEVHLYGEKRSYEYRLSAPERAAKSGFRSVTLGALLGLDNPVIDFFKASLHTLYIRDNFPGTEVNISLPRLRNSMGNSIKSIELSDKDITKFIIAYRLFIPRSGISLSTRESSKLRNNLLPLGITKMSAQSKTTVGGHSEVKGDEQFEISDKRSVKELHRDLVSMSFQPVYKDWDII
ncbi:MAG: 2-iminoacetate synthase ThiH [Spirochaetales bacterium]|nr:2-iminoacetate synthase ThiH [Spirochaetales bacterium]